MTLTEADRRSSAGILAGALRSSALGGLRVIWWATREVWWWCRRLAHLLVWNPLLMVVWSLSVVWLGARIWSDAHNGSVDEPTIVALTGLMLPVWVAGLWLRFAPMSYQVRVVVPAWRRRVERGIRSGWVVLMDTCGLGRRVATPQGAMTRVPQLAVACWRDNDLWIQPALLPGQTLDDVEAVAERLRVTVRATRLRIVAGPNLTSCWLVWSFEDRLARPFPAHVPAADDALSVADLGQGIPIGLTESGELWRLPLRLSTFVAGSSGSGKSSLIWGLVFGLAPGVRSGLVRLYGIDLKGGMELSMGRDLFTRYAQQPAQAVALLEAAAADLQGRAALLAGWTRQHAPSAADPLVVLIIDELAALVAYLPDRDLTKRAESALNIILSQGRAVGYVAVAFLQDPRKETVRNRHLFPQSLGLRLKDREEVAMVLGEGAIAAGAACHRISTSTPGVGYVLGEDGRPVKVRAGHVTDSMIRHVAATFAAPICEASEPLIVVTSQVRSTSRRSPRTSRRRAPEGTS